MFGCVFVTLSSHLHSSRKYKVSCIKAWSVWKKSSWLWTWSYSKAHLLSPFCSAGIRSTVQCTLSYLMGYHRVAVVEELKELWLVQSVGVSVITGLPSQRIWIHAPKRHLLPSGLTENRRTSQKVKVWNFGNKARMGALTRVGVYGEIRLALQNAVDQFSAVPVHGIVGVCRCHPSDRGTCETEGRSESVGFYTGNHCDLRFGNSE